jgi:indole-3-glycerol phosphate synthase
VNIPILRKDFMVDEYQFYEAKSIGADVILLIAACLSPTQVQEFTALAHELNLEVLLEIHTEEELEHFNSEIDLVGINNRNLKDFKVDLQHSVNLKNLLPKGNLSVTLKDIGYVTDNVISNRVRISDFNKKINGILEGGTEYACY